MADIPSIRLGIDLGGTKTEIIAIEARNGKELYRKRVPSPKGVYEDTVNNIKNLVLEAEQVLGGVGTVGVGIPGSIVRETGLVKNANSTWLNHHPLDKDLASAIDRPVRMENDANCLALSEATDGAGAGHPNVFAVIIGTGCGGGMVANGKLVSGRNGIGGEWGHNPLPSPRVYMEKSASDALYATFDKHTGIDQTKTIYPIKTDRPDYRAPEYVTHDMAWNEYPGDYCYCGRRSCQELWISGTGFKNDYMRVTGEDISTHDVIANAMKNDDKAKAALERYCDRLASALGVVVNMFDPDVIVLGGGMSNVEHLYTRVPQIWDRYMFTDVCRTALKPARHGDSSGVRGAAWLWDKDGN